MFNVRSRGASNLCFFSDIVSSSSKRSLSSSNALVFQKENVEPISLSASPQASEPEKFRILQLTKEKFERKQYVNRNERYFNQPREEYQPINQDWGSVWPAARTFHPSVVPLPIRMGLPRKSSLPQPDKWHNTELIKVANFLHLTPPVIKRQCEALKKFCTKWPDGLKNEEDQVKHFPVTVTTSTYLHSSPTIRDPRARIVTLSFDVESLKFNEKEIDKFLRLVGDHYDPETKKCSIVSDRCPLSTQNIDYCTYLLTVVFLESLKTETWEAEKGRDDNQYYIWQGSSSETSFKTLSETNVESITQEAKNAYSDVCAKLHNEGENPETMSQYGKSVLNIFGIGNL